jgi:arabinogalactan oligomer/maltooligosaccharide transport system permease protein
VSLVRGPAVLLAAFIAASLWALPSSAEDAAADARPELVLWHAYRAEEAATIEGIVDDLNRTRTDFRVKLLAVPYDAYLDKIGAAIPRGRGPDVFIAAHDPIGDWAKAGTIQAVDDVVDPQTASSLVPGLLPAVLFDGHVYGLPIAFKSVALWRNTALVKEAPTTLSQLLEVAKQQTGDGRYGLVYENRDLYFHAPLLFGYGGALFDDAGRPALTAPGTIRSVERAKEIADSGVVPGEVSGTLTMSLFNTGKAAMIITGPWSRGEIEPGVSFAVSPLPVVDDDAGKRPMRPLLTVEAVFISGKTEKRDLAVTLARLLADQDRSVRRLKEARQPVALASAWDALGDDDDARFLKGFRAQLEQSVPTPNTPAMKSLWGPFNLALGETMGQGAPAKDTLTAAQAKLDGVLAEVARTGEARGQTSFVVAVLLLMVALVAWMVVGMKKAGGVATVAKEAAENKVAYAYAAPAMIGTLILVLFPFSVGVGMGFFRHAWGTYTFVGLENFATILGDTDAAFFRTLGVTVLWTASNVFLHVAIGVVLALILSQARLRFKAVYRVLFIIPWAMPSYITALIWKGMFHPEFGAVNALLGTPGFSWMNQFWSAFLANLITNTWLGFPFMMVTALGGLTAIPKDIYEAAALDGAGPWKRFTSITLPLLRPTLAPAIVLGTVWTFNMFNVIYLVSGGAPGGRTDILITEAFRWAFERGQGGAFGTAAAYSTLIFLMLLAYDTASKRVMNNLKGDA